MDPVAELSRSVVGKVALITGAASGMGRATAFVFAREGARVAVTDFNAEGAEAVVAGIRAEGGQAIAWRLDVADQQDIRSVVEGVAGAFGGLDIVVNNAGISAFHPIEAEGYDETWDRAIGILLTAHQRIIRAALPHLHKSTSPRIINIASTEALGATARDSAYSAAKAGVTGLTRALAVELGRAGITVNCICPGPIRTGMTEGRQGHLRQAPNRHGPVWRSRRGGAYHAQPLPSGGLLHHGRDHPRGWRPDGPQRLSGRPMIKLTYCLTRLPGLTRGEFQDYWFNRHAPLVASVREVLKIERYVQAHSLPDEISAGLRASRGAPPAFDGVAQLWYPDLETLASLGDDPAAREAGRMLLEDEKTFIDLAKSPLWWAEEKVIF